MVSQADLFYSTVNSEVSTVTDLKNSGVNSGVNSRSEKFGGKFWGRQKSGIESAPQAKKTVLNSVFSAARRAAIFLVLFFQQ